jgi:hypothetical protein
LDEIYSTLPDLQTRARFVSSKSKVKKLELLGKSAVEMGRASNGGETLAEYYQYQQKMTIYKGSLVRTSPSLALGSRFNVSTDFKSVFRHEYGHHIHRNVLTQKSQLMVESAYNIQMLVDSKSISSTVSRYASTNSGEMFAEIFSAYTSPLYGTSPATTLPTWAVKLMEMTIGKRSKI